MVQQGFLSSIPAGYWPVPHMAFVIAKAGSEGRLPGYAGFAANFSDPDPIDPENEAAARFHLGQKLASGDIIARALNSLDGTLVELPPSCWRAAFGPHEALVSGFVERGQTGFPPHFVSLSARVLLIEKEVLANFSLVRADEVKANTEANASPVGRHQYEKETDPRPAFPTIETQKKKSARGYGKLDLPLVAEALEGLEAGRFRNPWDAAGSIVTRATGGGTVDTKTKRLSRLIKRAQEIGLEKLREELSKPE